MAEAEEVISDAARHATVFARDLWRRHKKTDDAPRPVSLNDVAARLDLLTTAVMGQGYSLRPAQPPAHTTMLSILFRHHRKPRRQQAIPATDGVSVWLPPDLGITNTQDALTLYRVMALQQTLRARRGSAANTGQLRNQLEADVYLLIEAAAVDQELIDKLPGMIAPLESLRAQALTMRPLLEHFSEARQPLEKLLRVLLSTPVRESNEILPAPATPEKSVTFTRQAIHQLGLVPEGIPLLKLGPQPLLKDWWTGDLRPPPTGEQATLAELQDQTTSDEPPPKTAQLRRRPDERKATEEEERDKKEDGIWMVQGDESHPHAEDPMGLQRPIDREDSNADEYGDLVSELSEARLVSTPGQPKEVLLSNDPPDARAKQELKAVIEEGIGFSYPEWDYRSRAYLEPGSTVRPLSCIHGTQAWVDRTLREHGAMLNLIRRRFEMLRAQPVRSRRQVDGDELDLEAYTESYSDYRAGLPMADGLYQVRRRSERNMAITLLIDISGSTDSWVTSNKRVIDVEREALLLVCTALESLGEPYSVQAFSGEGPNAVTSRQIKHFREPFSNEVALRISGLEPQHYTRAGAAIRHASTGLMAEAADNRLLLLLSDGKPSDKDDYEGRYGVEDTRQAVVEASLQGIYPFCLTIDRRAANYLPRIFGPHQYGLLTKPDRLATVLLDWMKRLVTTQH